MFVGMISSWVVVLTERGFDGDKLSLQLFCLRVQDVIGQVDLSLFEKKWLLVKDVEFDVG